VKWCNEMAVCHIGGSTSYVAARLVTLWMLNSAIDLNSSKRFIQKYISSNHLIAQLPCEVPNHDNYSVTIKIIISRCSKYKHRVNSSQANNQSNHHVRKISPSILYYVISSSSTIMFRHLSLKYVFETSMLHTHLSIATILDITRYFPVSTCP
jgi:hypothetical protein